MPDGVKQLREESEDIQSEESEDIKLKEARKACTGCRASKVLLLSIANDEK